MRRIICVLTSILAGWASAATNTAQPGIVSASTIRFGQEFWRNHSSSRPQPDISAAIERVRHAFRLVDGNGFMRSDRYAASLVDGVLSFSPALNSRNSRSITYASPFEFETISVLANGRELLQRNRTRPVFLGNTAQATLDAADRFAVHYQAGPEGVEVTWLIFARVAGPLTIQAQVSGYEYVSTTDSGLHFRAATGAGMVKLGNVVAVDAAGRSWALPARFENDTWQVDVPADILQSATLPLAIDPVVSPEFDVDTPVIVPEPANQFQPAIASNGREYLVVWSDTRLLSSSGFDIFGTRVLSNGVVADPSGIAISRRANDQFFPSVAACGSNFLVAWQQVVFTNGGATSYDIYGTRVAENGAVLDLEGFPISTALDQQRRPAVCASTSQWFVAWEDTRNGTNTSDIFGSRVTRDGTVLDPGGFAISTAADLQSAVAVAADSDSFLAVWEDLRTGSSYDVRAARISPQGQLLTIGVIISDAPGDQRFPRVAHNGTSFLVAWEDHGTGPQSDLFARYVDSAGLPLDGSGFPVSLDSGNQTRPDVTATGTNFFAVWADDRNGYNDIFGSRLAGTNNLDSAAIALTTDPNAQNLPRVAALPASIFVVWEDERRLAQSGRDIFGAQLSVINPLSPTNRTVSTDVNEETAPAVAFNGQEFLVVWADNRSSPPNALDIFGARISRSGALLDPNGLAISSAAGDQERPAVTASGSQFLVGWADHRAAPDVFVRSDIYAARVLDGVVLDPAGIPVQTGLVTFEGCAVAGSATGYLVTWRDYRSGTTLASIFGNIVRRDGNLSLSNGTPIGVGRFDRAAPAVSSNGRDYLVTFADDRDLPNGEGIYAARVTGDGVVLDTNNFRVTNLGRWPAVASNGTNYFVVWSEFFRYGITHGTAVLADGTVANVDGVVIRGQNSFRPAIAHNGPNYFMIWSDNHPPNSDLDPAIFGSGVFNNGTVTETNGFAIRTALGGQVPVSVAGDDNLYIAVSPGQSSGTTRVIANLVSLSGQTVITTITFTAGSGVTLRWFSEPGVTYRVEFKEDLNQPSWTPLPGDITADSAISSKTDPTATGSTTRFYRIVQVPAALTQS